MDDAGVVSPGDQHAHLVAREASGFRWLAGLELRGHDEIQFGGKRHVGIQS
jgi:hypothetical protein